jgi:hypothetical protein
VVTSSHRAVNCGGLDVGVILIQRFATLVSWVSNSERIMSESATDDPDSFGYTVTNRIEYSHSCPSSVPGNGTVNASVLAGIKRQLDAAPRFQLVP